MSDLPEAPVLIEAARAAMSQITPRPRETPAATAARRCKAADKALGKGLRERGRPAFDLHAEVIHELPACGGESIQHVLGSSGQAGP